MTSPIIKMAQGPISVYAEGLFFAQLTDDGTPGGSAAVTGDCSVTSVEYFAVVPPGKVLYAKAIDIYIQGAGNVTANGYGPMAALTNGMLLRSRNADGVDVVPPLTLTTTGSFSSIPGAKLEILEAGPGDNYLNVTWIFTDTAGYVVLRSGYKTSATCQDDLTSLTQHTFTVTGFIVDES